MKSSPNVHRHPSTETLKPWNASDLDVNLASLNLAQKDRILALFRSEEETASRRREAGSRSRLHPAATAFPLTNWFPGDMTLQPSTEDSEERAFVESPRKFISGGPREDRRQQAVMESEIAGQLERARAQAEQILLEARSAADNLLRQSQAEADRVRQDAHRQGLDEARREMQEALTAVRLMLEETRAWQSSLVQQGEPFLTEMLKEMAQTMFGEGVHLDANALQVNLNRIMEHAQRLGDLNILLNPRDAQLLDPSWSQYQLLITGNKVRIIPSEKITPGGCIVKGSTGMVDGRVETQLAAVLNSLEEIQSGEEP